MVKQDRKTPIIIEQPFDVTQSMLWDAISKPEHMKEWYFENIPDFKAEIGFETEFNVKAENRDFLHQWKVTEVIDENKLVYRWTFKGIEGRSFSIFQLFKNDNGSLLKLTCKGLETFPDDIPEFTRESALGGWNYIINQRLKEYLDQKN